MKGYLFLILIMLVGTVNGSYITINTIISAEEIIYGNETVINVTVSNLGDEPAYGIIISLILPEGFSSDEIYVGRLNPNENFTGRFFVRIDDNLLPGRYEIGVITDYKDLNDYPFSAISKKSIVLGRDTISKVLLSVSNVEISRDEKLIIRLRNLDTTEHQVRVRLFLPREFSSNLISRDIRIDPREEKYIEAKIENLNALVGSSYFIFATLEYEYNNMHHSYSSAAILKVVEEEDGEGIDLIFLSLIIIFVLLLIMFILLRFRGNERRK
ncbi:MAG: hypothetical protein DRO90_00570 [Candidatus Altiarchaeales archaeon]|nr:MAG: hypothetical protein DRO95_00880 [Candidatus Altiarchaeales archaeon]RLI94604.1 MAG: hypothetical protein DRO94_02525 [Candidatus Altiarchaeales archaeon]RLI95316.1 MAG: hypothetical protein DRO90_00570 [Candidatus Altiarchaeales archaeon]HDO82856.1 hypothetical protein [Candidatus Altiarchaeales archaeon]HEX55505.1 hypothetical protein [Candidatus Altiarchaeales archaeon]